MTMKRIKWIAMGSVFLIVVAGIFLLILKPWKPSRTIKVSLLYNYPLEWFPNAFKMSNGNPNHPNYFSVEVGLNCGPKEKPQYGIKAYSSEVYGTQVADICLNVETGDLKSYTSVSGISTSYDIACPEKGGNYYDYLAQLSSAKDIIETVAAGCNIPEEGFNYPQRPELKGTSKYIDQIVTQLQNTKTIDAVTFRLPVSGSFFRLGKPEKVAIEYKTSQDREFLIRFLDKIKTYSTTRMAVKKGSGILNLDISLPGFVNDPGSTYMNVSIVPKGTDLTRKLADSVIKKQSVSGDYIWNLYLYPSVYDIVYAGKKNTIYMNWQVLGTRKVIVRLLDVRGKILASFDFLATDGRESDRKLDLNLSADLPRSKNCKIVVRIVPREGKWSDFLVQKELPVRIE